MPRAPSHDSRIPRVERPGFVTDAEPFGILGLEALLDRLVWRATRGDCAC
ncbi:hypothetical protein [Roseivivax sediminis]|uniref:Uncharacterized protein n=1 Tax=Roseivivax sediminis TaxID=936889 RepID=A0A1I1ZC79_9RHOB|nr:hypothetical protein [Roseivivax sediminis]SFE29361.1 hypothetical protein SAMN04515678_10889 [Roseivivax sediminis]